MFQTTTSSIVFALLTFSCEASESYEAVEKPWYMQKIKMGDSKLPVSPISLAVLGITLFYWVYFSYGNPVYVVASHILVSDKDEGVEEKLEEWRDRIGKDASLFAKYAKSHSTCPSRRTGGNLGKFKRFDMAEKFDELCFNPRTPIQTCVGPIHTQFGWHLIFLHDRQLDEKKC